MKYLINRKTKEHRIAGKDWQDTDTDYWRVVQADDDGWIPHVGDVWTLPGDVRCDIRCADGSESSYGPTAASWMWPDETITHYRPILEPEKAQEPVADERERKCAELQKNTMRNPKSITEMIKESDVKASSCMDVITRLSIAHAQAQTIPDIEAELREVLGSMGYDLVSRSPFEQQRHGAEGE